MVSALTVAGAGRPYPGESVTGDAWTVHRQGDVWRIAVVDGLGHGPDAAEAANAALGILDAQPQMSPVDALRACHAALRGTRGAAIGIALIDLERACLSFVGVGNVEAHLRQSGAEQRLISYRGIVGAVLPTPRSFDYPLASDWLLVLHTDGVSARFDLEMEAGEVAGQPAALADRLLERWARATDDATVVVVVPGAA